MTKTAPMKSISDIFSRIWENTVSAVIKENATENIGDKITIIFFTVIF